MEEVLVCVQSTSVVEFPDLSRFVPDPDIPFLSRVIWDMLLYPHVSVFPVI